jgi:leader peptidase (prepilin peptidase)/N-methyltransferase
MMPFRLEAAVLVPLALTFGLVIGSFLNVCIHRLPRGVSVVAPRSTCPGCRQVLAWHDNVPLLSYVWLLARCRRCARPISWRYPLVEALTGALFAALALRFGGEARSLPLFLFAAACLALMIIDAEHRILPNAITLPGVAVGLATSFVNPRVTPVSAVVGAALGWALPWVLATLYRRIRRRDGIGIGDLKMLAMIGAFLGWRGVLFALGAGSILGTVIGIPYLLIRSRSLTDPLPFGTFLGAAALLDLLGASDLVLRELGL